MISDRTVDQARGRRTPARRAALALSALLALSTVAALQPTGPADAAGKSLGIKRNANVTMNVETGEKQKRPRIRTWETGKVRRVPDGDTIRVKLKGKKAIQSVRLTGIQATEVARQGSPAECHSVPARNALRRLVQGKQVRLKSVSRSSRASKNRLQRHVFVKHKGKWRDVATILLRQGHVMAHPMVPEWNRNVRYSRLMQGAMGTPKRMWNPRKCGSGPQQHVPIDMWIAWDAPGPDNKNVNGEYAVIRNLSSTETLRLGGWKLRETSLKHFTFPSWAEIPPGGHVQVHSGRGTHTADRFYWGASRNIWQNPDERGYADTGVLVDPDGSFRAWFTYPCFKRCADPLTGKLRITQVVYDPPGNDHEDPNRELIRLTNTSGSTIGLGGYYVQRGASVKLEFEPRRTLGPGQTLTVRTGKGTNSSSTMHFQENKGMLNNAGSTVSVASWNGVRVDCHAWKKGRC